MIAAILSVIGLSLFEIISSVDNAIVNAEVLSTMKPAARKLFLVWGLLFAVVVVRGILPLLIVWLINPSLGFLGAMKAAITSDPEVAHDMEKSAPYLLLAGGIFMVFVFFHWLFLEEKHFGLPGEKFIFSQGVWFYAVISIILSVVVWLAVNSDAMLAFSAVVGSTVFFITHGFKQQAEMAEKKLLKKGMSDFSKLLYLEVIDTTFSIDGVIGAFAFTLSVPIILLGNGLGALVLRQLTISGIDKIKKYVYLKNGAMYSILFLGTIMILDSFGAHIPHWLSPMLTFATVGYFYLKSKPTVK